MGRQTIPTGTRAVEPVTAPIANPTAYSLSDPSTLPVLSDRVCLEQVTWL